MSNSGRYIDILTIFTENKSGSKFKFYMWKMF